MCIQQRLGSAWAGAQADLSLRWAHMLFCWFCHEAPQIVSVQYQNIRVISVHIWIQYIQPVRKDWKFYLHKWVKVEYFLSFTGEKVD